MKLHARKIVIDIEEMRRDRTVSVTAKLEGDHGNLEAIRHLDAIELNLSYRSDFDGFVKQIETFLFKAMDGLRHERYKSKMPAEFHDEIDKGAF